MKINNSFVVPAPPEEVWLTLLDVPAIVGCVPGAQLTSNELDNEYTGIVAVKLGPVALKFKGKAEIEKADHETRTAWIKASGSDQQGRGNAGANSRMVVNSKDAGSLVEIETDLQLSGLVAQYGRASGMIKAVSSTIISQFAKNLEEQIRNAKDFPADARHDPQENSPKKSAASENHMGIGVLVKIFINWLRELVRPTRGS